MRRTPLCRSSACSQHRCAGCRLFLCPLDSALSLSVLMSFTVAALAGHLVFLHLLCFGIQLSPLPQGCCWASSSLVSLHCFRGVSLPPFLATWRRRLLITRLLWAPALPVNCRGLTRSRHSRVGESGCGAASKFSLPHAGLRCVLLVVFIASLCRLVRRLGDGRRLTFQYTVVQPMPADKATVQVTECEYRRCLSYGGH